MIKFTIDNVFTKALCNQPHEYEAIDACLSYQIPNAWIIKRNKLISEPHSAYWKNWTGINSFFIKDNGSFLTGLLPKVQEFCASKNIEYMTTDNRDKLDNTTKANIAPGMLKGITLYDFQVRTAMEFCDIGNGVLQLPTGSGKTEIAVAITKALEVPTLFLTHRVTLLHQTAARFQKRWPGIKSKIGIVGDKQYSPNLINFATVQTLQSMKKRSPQEYADLLSKAHLLIIDEAHRSGAKQFYEPAIFCKNARYRLALTATPFMTNDDANNMYLMGITGPVVSRVSNSELIERGILARPFFKFFKIEAPDLSEFTKWQDVYERGIVTHPHRNAFIVSQAVKLANDDKKTLIVVSQVAHGKILNHLLAKNGVACQYVDGGTSYPEREKALKWLMDKGNVIIATNIFDEGVDVVGLNAVILAGGQKAPETLFQRIGRTTRKKAADNYAIIIDFIDSYHPTLLDHSMQRYNLIKNEEGFTIL